MKEKRERGQGQIREHGSKLQIRYYRNGERIEESTRFADSPEGRKKAEKLLRRRLGEIEAGIHRDTRRVMYTDLRESLYADYENNERKSLRHDKQGKPLLHAVVRLDNFFSGYRASEIDPDLIRKFIADQQGRGLANGTINRSISALRHMFHLAAKDGKLQHIPSFPMPKEPKPRKGFFEHEQYRALSAALPTYLRLPFAVGYYSGMRLGEILSLKWEQVDFLAGTIELLPGETKNDEARTIPIIPQLRTLLLEQRAKRQPDCQYVCFRLDRKGHAVKIGSFRKVWQSASMRVGLGKMEPAVDRTTGEPLYATPRGPRSKPKVKMVYRGMIFHDLRRTGVRNLVRAGVSEKVAQDISGHKTRSVFQRYNISSRTDVTEAGRKLAAFHEKFGDNSGTICTEVQQAHSAVN